MKIISSAMHVNPGSSVESLAFTQTMHFFLIELGAGIAVLNEMDSEPVLMTKRKFAGPSKSIIDDLSEMKVRFEKRELKQTNKRGKVIVFPPRARLIESKRHSNHQNCNCMIKFQS